MKVIKKNNFSNIFPMRIICKRVVDADGGCYGKEEDYCHSELEIDKEDIKKHLYSVGWAGRHGVDYGVICPLCGKFIVIDKNMIPETVLNNAEEIRLN